MKIRQMVKRVLYPNCWSSDALKAYIVRLGGQVGEGTVFFDPKNTGIDEKRATYLRIGEYCKISSGVQFLCHDYSWSVLRKSHDVILPDPGRPITIGKNCFLGWNALVIGPVTIGDNVIVGANSVVTKDIPSGSVAAGNPARVIRTLDEHYEMKRQSAIQDAFARAKHVLKTTGAMPTEQDMGWFAVLFLERTAANETRLQSLPFRGDSMDEVLEVFRHTEPVFHGLQDLLAQMIAAELGMGNES